MLKTFVMVTVAAMFMATSAFAFTSGGNAGNSVKVDRNGVRSHLGVGPYPRFDKGYKEYRLVHLGPNGCPFDGQDYVKNGILKQQLAFHGYSYSLNASQACGHPSRPNR